MRKVLFVGAILSILVTGRVGARGAAAQAAEVALSRPVAEATLDLGMDLYAVLKKGPENLILSPYSLASALAMVRAGAKGRTASQLDAVLHHGPLATLDSQRALRTVLHPRPNPLASLLGKPKLSFSLHEANAVWIKEGLCLVPSYPEELAKHFQATVEQVDFGRKQETCERINGWVAKQTQEHITNIVDPGDLGSLTGIFLASAIYFNASWAEAFEKGMTCQEPFHVHPDCTAQVFMMHRQERLNYFEDDRVQVVELPYVRKKTSMVIVLPRKRFGLVDEDRKLTAMTVRTWIEKLRKRNVSLDLPRFSFDYTAHDLVGSLKRLGLTDAFSLEANFSGISCSESLFLSGVAHKAFIDVDESGTRAAAVTTVRGYSYGSDDGPEDPVAFVADHPFFFLIRHVETGTILFVGCVHQAGGA